MLKFNNNHIITGEIKQFLKDFNLPKARVDSDRVPIIHDALYIKDGMLQKGYNRKTQAAPGSLKPQPVYPPKFIPLRPYIYGEEIPNVTKNLVINNLIYDSYTHKYLGDYLRFYRDMNGVNLMSMYNCFSDELCKNLKIESSEDNISYSFNTAYDNFKIYMIPIKWFEDYTVAIDCDSKIELIVGIYKNGVLINTDMESSLYDKSYQKLSGTRFSKPFLYTKAGSIKPTPRAYKQEENLKLFIKVPATSMSSVVVLEGDYTNNSKLYFSENTGFSTRKITKEICNYETGTVVREDGPDFIYEGANREREYISRSQLLDFSSTESYPFADRLIEYLFGNVITSDDEISSNIQRVQKRLVQRYNEYLVDLNGDPVYLTNMFGDYVLSNATSISKNAFANLSSNDPRRKMRLRVHKHVGTASIIDNPAVWSTKLKNVCYDVLLSSDIPSKKGSNKFDLIGYVDKDAEQAIGEYKEGNR